MFTTYYMQSDTIMEPLVSKRSTHFVRKNWISGVEKRVSQLFMQHPHPNIATVYQINDADYGIQSKDTFVDVEMLNMRIDFQKNKASILAAMRSVQEYLHTHNIMYINWTPHSIGLSDDGQYKLFDFHACGITHNGHTGWLIQPAHIYNYNKALDAGIESPLEIDAYCFETFLQNVSIKHGIIK